MSSPVVEETTIQTVESTYEAQAVLQECHECAIYGLAFNHYRKDEDVFATVGSNRATIYRCERDGTFQFLQSHVDEDEAEEFYVCQWSMDPSDGRALLIFAGKKGIVRVLDTRNSVLLITLIGHGQAINDLSIFPTKPQILLTASKDESIRVWNLKTGVTICSVAGDGGHTAEVISIDGHLDGQTFVTSGMDDCIKIWSLKHCLNLVEASETWDMKQKQVNFPTVHLEYPIFSTTKIHGNYVDCVRWYGDLVISKGVDERIMIFKPLDLPTDRFATSETYVTLLEFDMGPCEVWYVRFALDFEFHVLACGDQEGRIHVWDMRHPHNIQRSCLQHKKCSTVIRQTAVSLDGSIILGSGDSGEVWRWDRKKSQNLPMDASSHI